MKLPRFTVFILLSFALTACQGVLTGSLPATVPPTVRTPPQPTLPPPGARQLQQDLATVNWTFVPVAPSSPAATGALTQEQAIETVGRRYPLEQASKVTAYIGWLSNDSLKQSRQAGESVDPTFLDPRLVWIVMLSGVKQQSSGPPGHPRKVSNELNVVIDAKSGAYLMSFVWTRWQPEDAWAAARAALPAEVPVYRPTWLPARFQAAPELWYAKDRGGDIGPTYLIGYRSDTGDVLHFALGGVNTSRPDTIEHITVRGVEATLVTTPAWPKVGISWQEGERVYHVQGYGDHITREELVRIVESLAPVHNDVATPTAPPAPAIKPGTPHRLATTEPPSSAPSSLR